MNEKQLRTWEFLQLQNLIEIEDQKVREEFTYEMAKHYLADHFEAVRQNSERFGKGKFTQRLLSQISGIYDSWICNFARGRIDNPGLKTLVRLANALGCAVEIRFVPHSYYLKLNANPDQRGFHPIEHVPSYEEERRDLQSKTGVPFEG